MKGKIECYFSDDHFADLLPHPTGVVACMGDKENGTVYECRDCGLVFVPKKDPQAYLALYSDPKRYFEASVSIGYKTFEERFWHDHSIAEVRVNNLTQMVDGRRGRVLDVGCGNCALLARLAGEGFLVEGVDLDGWSVKRAHQIQECSCVLVQIGDFLDVRWEDSAKFDVVMFTDSFEHFLYPHTCVRHAVDLLSDNGTIVIETPDITSEGYRKQRLNWVHVKPKEHPFLFSLKHIEALFHGTGVRLIRTVFTIPGRAVYYLQHE